MVDPVSGGSGFTNTTVTAKGKSVLGKDDFLTLMLAQMKNQDPMNPQDSSQYSAQLAQFSSLEQLQNINKNLETSVNANYQLTQSIGNTMTATLIGKDVKLNSSTIKYNGEESVKLGFNLPADASSLTIKIYDKNKTLVKTVTPSDRLLGDHTYTWDFKNNDGNTVAKGDYTYTLETKGMNGQDMKTTSWLYGQIAGIRFGENGTKILVGKSEFQLSDISEIVNH